MLEGMVWADPTLMKVDGHNVVVRRDVAENDALRHSRVALISGIAPPPHIQRGKMVCVHMQMVCGTI